jgi:Cu(I)/Ag(I) efflux system membrane fusion protein
MTRSGLFATAVAIIAAAGVAFVTGRALRLQPADYPVVTAAIAADTDAPAYFQHPDGKPIYSLTP